MNNIVEIIYNKSERYPKISINGEAISRYMELSDLVFDDIFHWARRFYESMDDELSEQYTVYLTGHPFHYRVLKAFEKSAAYCTAIRFTPIEYRVPMEAKMAYAQELNGRFHLGIRWEGECVHFCSDEPERFQAVASCTTDADHYYITAGDQFPANSKYCVCISEEPRFEKARGVSYLYLPEHLLPELVEYFNLYHLQLKFVGAVFAAVGDLAMTQEEKLKFEAYASEEYRVIPVSFPEKMDRGQKYQLEYIYYPQQLPDPEVILQSSNPNAVFASDELLFAQASGMANITLVDRSGNNYGTYPITVEAHNYINNISIILPATSLRINETLNIKCLFSPNDAEDMHSVRYTVSDPSVAVFSGQSEIYGLTAGRVKVTVSTARVSKSVYLTVLPIARDVILPATHMEMPVNADAYIACSVVPMNATPMPTASWYSSNPQVVRVESYEGLNCKVSSITPGTATLTCTLDGTNISNTIQVTVERIKGCYVATAVYGDYDCPQVWILRRYRDQYLSSRRFGRAFIKVYYALSPTAVKLFGKTRWFNHLWRNVLDRKICKLKASGYEDTPYND